MLRKQLQALGAIRRGGAPQPPPDDRRDLVDAATVRGPARRELVVVERVIAADEDELASGRVTLIGRVGVAVEHEADRRDQLADSEVAELDACSIAGWQAVENEDAHSRLQIRRGERIEIDDQA